jgi:hypothetical protein
MTYFNIMANSILLFFWTAAALGAEAPAPARDSSTVTLSNPLAAQSLEQLSATLDRPLFSPSRRRTPAPVTTSAQLPVPAAPPPDLILSGIVMDGSGARAVIQVGAEKRTLRAIVGDNIDGWTVTRIEGRKLVLSLDGRFVTFTLFNRGADQRTDGPPSKTTNPLAAPPLLQLKQQNPSASPAVGLPRNRRRMGE